ncbi:hypothetical protein [Rhizobium sp. MHM7A]|uniref:hypothetical protein n=1 Tax=Rhizobium sp. MHM7A TaxID=2583233 RepID=UPI0011063B7C|nr:hypothetical protein [Rhizobium sp. MHM7A]TLX16730.1 hypothetical protein FFR93_05145 [Rhizobium sp. MHM7A]
MDWNLFLLIFLTPVCIIGTAIYAGMESMSRRPAPLWAYPVFFTVALALLFSLFGDYNLLPVT